MLNIDLIPRQKIPALILNPMFIKTPTENVHSKNKVSLYYLLSVLLFFAKST